MPYIELGSKDATEKRGFPVIYRNWAEWGNCKGRLIKKDNYYIAEEKSDYDKEWFPGIAGTKEFLCLTDLEISRAIIK